MPPCTTTPRCAHTSNNKSTHHDHLHKAGLHVNSSSCMGFAVRRTSRSYVRPSAATPSGALELSIIDRVVGLRHLVRSLHVFAPRRGGGGEPAHVVREALGKALVDYYPFAGRFVDGPTGPGSARVECTGEGAWFVEAVAGCSLEDVKCLDHPLVIPEDDLLPDAAPGVQPLDIPLMMQVHLPTPMQKTICFVISFWDTVQSAS